jgi:hypothetical protein
MPFSSVPLFLRGMILVALSTVCARQGYAQVDSTTPLQSDVVLVPTDGSGVISGLVVSAHSGVSLEGAHVFVKNDAQATVGSVVTDGNGKFRIAVRDRGPAVLHVQMRGFKQVTAPIDTRRGIRARVSMRFNPPRVDCGAHPRGSICI